MRSSLYFVIYVYLCVCFILCTLGIISHFLIDSHQNWHKRKTPKVETSLLGLTSHHLFP